jgi:catechol 2,3-dioxygenase-like lactoylglutathione lyase family enzyme
MIVGFDHIHFYCGDVEKTATYFRDFYGGKELSRENRPNSVRVIRMEVQGVPISLMSLLQDNGQLDPGKRKRGLDHLGFKVKDLKSFLEEMKKKGLPVTQDLTVTATGVKMAFVEGPEGIRIELVERD